MLASFDDRLCLELLLNPIKLFLLNDCVMQSFIDFGLMFDLTYVDGIDQNVMYAPTAPVPIWPERIYGTLYFAQSSKLLIEIKDTSYIRRSLFTYLKRL